MGKNLLRPVYLRFTYGSKQNAYHCFSRFPVLTVCLPPEMHLWHYLICCRMSSQAVPYRNHTRYIHTARLLHPVPLNQRPPVRCFSWEHIVSKTAIKKRFLPAASSRVACLDLFWLTDSSLNSLIRLLHCFGVFVAYISLWCVSHLLKSHIK